MDFPLTVEFQWANSTWGIRITGRDNRLCGVVAFEWGLPRATVYADEAGTTPIYKIKETPEKSTDWIVSTPTGEKLGAVRRSTWRSIWEAHYVIEVGDKPAFEVIERATFTKVLNFLVGFLPLLDKFDGYFLNPSYRITRIGGDEEVLRLAKERSLHSMLFSIDLLGPLSAREREVALLSLLMVANRERTRG